MKLKIKKLYDDYAKKFGTVVWQGEFYGVELAITQNPYPDGTNDFGGERYFTALAMDKAGNRWVVFWQPRDDAYNYDHYADQVEDWDKPYYAEMVDVGYYLD